MILFTVTVISEEWGYSINILFTRTFTRMVIFCSLGMYFTETYAKSAKYESQHCKIPVIMVSFMSNTNIQIKSLTASAFFTPRLIALPRAV